METALSIDKFELIPGRVEMAMQYVRHCQNLMVPDSCFGSETKGRELTQQGQAAYLAALDALRLYFTAEMDFGGPPTRIPEGLEDVATAHNAKREKRQKKGKR
jgi:hypothetical protein